MLMSIGTFMLCKVFSARNHKPFRVHQPTMAPRFFFGKSFFHHCVDDEIRNTGRSFACTEEKNGLIDKLSASHSQSGKKSGERHCRSALNIIVEKAHLVSIFL